MTEVRIETEGDVFVVVIDRPHRRNAIDGVTATQLTAAFRDFDADDRFGAAVLTGAGGTFCSGADLHGVAEGRGNRVVPPGEGDGPLGCTRLELTKPVIAAIEGHAVAGGLELALWCDLRVAARRAVLGVYCRRWGVPLVDGGTFRLPRLIGEGRALDLILTGRGVGADEALAMGLVSRVVDDGTARTAAVALAAELAALPPGCLRSDRWAARHHWGLDEQAALMAEYEQGIATIRSGETAEGARRFAAGAGRHGTAAPMGT
jgi:enoyl-CoA hydratase